MLNDILVLVKYLMIRTFIKWTIVLVAMLLNASNVFAAERYLSISAGTFSPSRTTTTNSNLQPVTTSYNTGWAVGGAYGVGFDNGLRLENELSYKTASPDASALGWLINVWWDAKNSTPFTPYFGGGFGFGRGHAASPGIVDTDITGLSYQAGGGVAWKLQPSLTLDIGYRYFGITSTSSGNLGSSDLAGPSIVTGLRLKFSNQ